MRFTNIVFAAFVAISQFAIAAPIESEALQARTKPKAVVIPVIGNDNNAIVSGSGNGGHGGTNYAVPVAVAGSKSSTWGSTKGPVVVVSSAGNEVGQDASGGDGSAVGTYGSNNHFARGVKPVVVPVFDNDNNAVIIGSGNGGNGGVNYAAPVAVAGSKSSTKGKTGWVTVGSSASNVVGQDASGGDGSAVGSYGSHNHFARGGTKPVIIPVVNNDNNAIVANSGNGGNGGKNIAVPVAVAGSKSSTSSWGWGKTGNVGVVSVAENAVGQDASGGDGSAVGTFGEHNHFSRGYTKPVIIPVVGNDNNAIIANSGNGGNGGKNIALPVAFAGSQSSTSGKTGKVTVVSAAGNVVGQDASGGDGAVVGTYGEHNHFARGYSKPVVIPVLADNDNNAVIIGSGNGGNGGLNVAVPVAIAASGSKSKGKSSGGISVGTGAGNVIGQDASGGDGSAVGSYGSGNHF